MLSTERQAFESQLAVLFGAFPTFLTQPRIEAYWRGLLKMHLQVFERCVDRLLGEQGDDKLPTVNRIWQVSRELRSHTPAQPVETSPAQLPSTVWLYGNRAMFNYLLRRGGAGYEQLLLMLAEKKRICDAYELIVVDEPEAGLELRDKLFEAWDRVYVQMSAEELREEQEFYWRTGRCRDWRDPAHLAATRWPGHEQTSGERKVSPPFLEPPKDFA